MRNREPVIKDHKHKLQKAWTRGYDFVGLRCKNCEYEIERKATPFEKKRIRADHERGEARSAAMHKLNWEFGKMFMNPRWKPGENSKWKYQGYDLMTRIRKWAKKYPKDVIVCNIDDSYNASSDLVFVLHRIGRTLWGTTCYTITQCDGQPPHEWFMYPGHRKGIQEALKVMAKLKPMRY
jgi:hypothetical protein